MYVFFIVLQVVIAALLMIVILIQQGRGSGLVEAFSGVESIFGAKTNVFLVRITSILATLFIINSLFLTYLSTQRSKSLMQRQDLLPQQAQVNSNQTVPQPGQAEIPNQEVQQGQVQEGADKATATTQQVEVVIPEQKTQESVDTSKPKQ